MTFAKDIDQRREKLGKELPEDFKIEESKSSLD
jgi:hypothetical protein